MVDNRIRRNVWNDRVEQGYVRTPDSFRPWYLYAERLLSTIEIQHQTRVLDVGCGVGEFLNILMRIGFQGEGIDGNDTQVTSVRAAGFSARVVDLEEPLPFDNDTFLLATCLEVIEHIARAEAMLREIHRVLKSNGWLLISTPNFSFLNNRFRYLLGATPYNEGVHLRFFTKSRLEQILSENGFHIAGSNSYGVVPAVSTITMRLLHRKPVLWQVPARLESLLAYDLIYLARKID